MDTNKDMKPTEKALKVVNLKSEKTDPQGSYTGVPLNEDEEPVQDSDDL